MYIPFVDLSAQYRAIKNSIDEAIEAVIRETAFIGGKPVKQFEEDFAKIYGAKHVVTCGNGTDSLYIIMKTLGIGQGDEVITVANSWISSSETITQTGARPVFVDVHPVYFSMDEQMLKSLITSKTKAIIAVHLQGQMCDIDSIQKICEDKGLFLIEDCAQAHFSELGMTRAGLTGIASSFSFYPGKNLGAYGDAGCIVTHDEEFAKRCRMFANHGALLKHQHEIEGINSRMDGLQAAILSAKLPFVLSWTQARIVNARLYDKYLSQIPQISIPVVRPGSKHSFHLYVIKAKDRDKLRKFLKEKGIETFIHYPTPLPFLPAYNYLGHKREDFPVAAELQAQILSLPMYPELTEEKISYVASAIKDFYKNKSH